MGALCFGSRVQYDLRPRMPMPAQSGGFALSRLLILAGLVDAKSSHASRACKNTRRRNEENEWAGRPVQYSSPTWPCRTHSDTRRAYIAFASLSEYSVLYGSGPFDDASCSTKSDVTFGAGTWARVRAVPGGIGARGDVCVGAAVMGGAAEPEYQTAAALLRRRLVYPGSGGPAPQPAIPPGPLLDGRAQSIFL